uniref:Uncharacterized protein n=1 Tax=viral metagenome TaxID=1070528 RepID=A0A6H1ZFK8_9ZZZZ
MSETKSVFLFASIIWICITCIVLWDWYGNIEEKIKWNEFVKAGNCVVMDQFGWCWSAEEWQSYLDETKEVVFE